MKTIRSLRFVTLYITLIVVFSLSPAFSNEFTETRMMMGTFVSITIRKSNGPSEKIVDNAFREIYRLESIMSTFKTDSDISKLNRKGHLDGDHPELREVILGSLYYSRISEGAFDITVKPILDVYRECYQVEGRAPTTVEISNALELVDYNNVVVGNNQIYFKKPGTKITTDGIAKSYIVDRAIQILEKNGIRNGMVAAGGDIRAIGRKSDTKPWTIALENPREKDEYLAIIHLEDGQAISTSGDYERYFVPDKSIHHIIDPKTGRSATALISATVIAKTAMEADALATAVFVLGPPNGMKLIGSLEEVEALLVTRDREILISQGFRIAAKLPRYHNFTPRSKGYSKD